MGLFFKVDLCAIVNFDKITSYSRNDPSRPSISQSSSRHPDYSLHRVVIEVALPRLRSGINHLTRIACMTRSAIMFQMK